MQGVSVNYGETMQVRKGRLGKWIPALLTVVGSLALASGVFVAVITMTRTPANHRGIGLSPHNAVYVGADTCFTCHEAGNPDWSQMLPSEPIIDPQAGLVDVSARTQIPRAGGAAAQHVDIIGAMSDGVSQNYVIATESDQIRLPGQRHPAVEPPAGTANCTDCHDEAKRPADDEHVEQAQGLCIVCHPVANRVSRANQPARVQYG